MNNNSKVLALKYRPQTFHDLIGQEVVAETITNSIKADKIPNAYLFTGIRVEGVSGSNSVKITLDGEGEMQTIKLSDEIMKEDKTIIEDLIVAAHNGAKSQLKSKTTEEISKATGGFGIPGFKWPL